MTETKLVEVRTFLNKSEAEIAQGALKAAGIEAMLAPDDAGGMEPGLWMGGVKLLARPADAARARKILSQAK